MPTTIGCVECSWFEEYTDPTEPMKHYCPECGEDVIIDRGAPDEDSTGEIPDAETIADQVTQSI